MSPLRAYLGDAVYVDFDGFSVVLTTEDGVRENEPDRARAAGPPVPREVRRASAGGPGDGAEGSQRRPGVSRPR